MEGTDDLTVFFGEFSTTNTILGIETIFIALLYDLRRNTEPNFIDGARKTWEIRAAEDAKSFGTHLEFYNFETRILITLTSNVIKGICKGEYLSDLQRLPATIPSRGKVENRFGFVSPIFQWPESIAATPQAPPEPPTMAPVAAPLPTPAVTEPPQTATVPVKIDHGGTKPFEKELEKDAEALAAQQKKVNEATVHYQLLIYRAIGAIASTSIGIVAVVVSMPVINCCGCCNWCGWYLAKQEPGHLVRQTIYIENNRTLILNMVDGERTIIKNPKTIGDSGETGGPPGPGSPGGGEDSGETDGSHGSVKVPGSETQAGKGGSIPEPGREPEPNDPEPTEPDDSKDDKTGTKNGKGKEPGSEGGTIDGADQGTGFGDPIRPGDVEGQGGEDAPAGGNTGGSGVGGGRRLDDIPLEVEPDREG
ncbi:hypothetical protein IFR04_014863 [Cadophora malorum]|uniref:Uncharacterized protein n=1 Tax=Cadophora malorum TaxID=108018 RepID=A0A8H7W1U3_9HELO|nr:hypothetical protein IFR04_014863 [Cadophora malorum]